MKKFKTCVVLFFFIAIVILIITSQVHAQSNSSYCTVPNSIPFTYVYGGTNLRTPHVGVIANGNGALVISDNGIWKFVSPIRGGRAGFVPSKSCVYNKPYRKPGKNY